MRAFFNIITPLIESTTLVAILWVSVLITAIRVVTVIGIWYPIPKSIGVGATFYNKAVSIESTRSGGILVRIAISTKVRVVAVVRQVPRPKSSVKSNRSKVV